MEVLKYSPVSLAAQSRMHAHERQEAVDGRNRALRVEENDASEELRQNAEDEVETTRHAGVWYKAEMKLRKHGTEHESRNH